MNELKRNMTADTNDDGTRLDSFLAARMADGGAYSRSYIQQMIERGNVTVNGQIKPKNTKIKCGDLIEAEIPPPAELSAVAQDLPLDIVYQDASLLVVNKPRGMVVHPAPGSRDNTLVNALLFHCKDQLSGINGVLRPGIVHRIDKDTSGLLVVAITDTAHRALAKQLENHTMQRVYDAVVHGVFKEPTGTVDRPIGRDERDRKRYKVDARGAKPAVTCYEVVEQFERFCHVQLRLETGRTHQIRVHMAAIGHAVAGDPVYAPKNTPNLGGQCLHAGTLGFRHPVTAEMMTFHAPLPPYFQKFIEKLRGGKHG